MKKPVIIVLILAVIIVGAGVYFMTRPDETEHAHTDSTSENKTSTTSPDTNTDGTPATATDENQTVVNVTYSDEGFSPASITIKAGEQIKFVNNSSTALQVGSDPHPQHTDNEELNAGTVAKGGSVTLTLSAKGTWSYHNHLNSGDGGTVIVE